MASASLGHTLTLSCFLLLAGASNSVSAYGGVQAEGLHYMDGLEGLEVLEGLDILDGWGGCPC